MEVEVAEWREIEHPLRDDAAVTDDDDGVGLDVAAIGRGILRCFDAVGLCDGKVQLQGGRFYWRCHEFEAAAFGTVGLGHDEVQAESGGDQLLERGNGESGVPQKTRFKGIG